MYIYDLGHGYVCHKETLNIKKTIVAVIKQFEVKEMHK